MPLRYDQPGPDERVREAAVGKLDALIDSYGQGFVERRASPTPGDATAACEESNVLFTTRLRTLSEPDASAWTRDVG